MANGVAESQNQGLVDVEELRKEVEAQKPAAYDFTYEHGRRYTSKELGNYFLPNDEPELQRLNDQHWTFTQVKGGNIYNAPITKDRDGFNVLDIGCGTGVWCIQMAADYPKAKIIGIDIAPVQNKEKPPNVEWIQMDVEKEWPFPDDYFDFIHLGVVSGCVADWGRTMETIVRHLAPGGYVEHQEGFVVRPYIVDADGAKMPDPSKMDDLPAFARWGRLMEQGAENRGRTLYLAPKLKEMQTLAGLQDVTETTYPIPIGTWPTDKQQKLIGSHMLLNGLGGMDGFTTMMFTKALGWSLESTKKFIDEVKTNLRDDSCRKVVDFYVVYGRKPGGSDLTTN